MECARHYCMVLKCDIVLNVFSDHHGLLYITQHECLSLRKAVAPTGFNVNVMLLKGLRHEESLSRMFSHQPALTGWGYVAKDDD
jgi:hypothetical protein